MKSRLFVFVFIVAVSMPAAAFGQFYEGARPAALGDAYSSIATGNEALYFNPAGMSLYINRYNLDVGWAYNPTSGLNQFNASIVDSSTTAPLGVGVAFSYFFGHTVPEPQQDSRGYRIDLGISYPMGTKKALVGLDMKYANMDINSNRVNLNSFTFDTGMLFAPSPYVRMSVVGRNLINTGSRTLPYQSVVGISAGKEPTFWISADVTTNYFKPTWDDIFFQYAAGAEFFLGKVVALRAGYLYDGANYHQQFVSAGLGIVTEKVGFSMTYKQNVVTTDDRYMYLVLNIYLGTQ